MINLVILTAVMSAPNSILYSTGCHLYQIVQDLPNRFLEAIKAKRQTFIRSRARRKSLLCKTIPTQEQTLLAKGFVRRELRHKAKRKS